MKKKQASVKPSTARPVRPPAAKAPAKGAQPAADDAQNTVPPRDIRATEEQLAPAETAPAPAPERQRESAIDQLLAASKGPRPKARAAGTAYPVATLPAPSREPEPVPPIDDEPDWLDEHESGIEPLPDETIDEVDEPEPGEREAAEPAAADPAYEPVAPEAVDEPVTTEPADEPVTTEPVDEPVTSELEDEPEAIQAVPEPDAPRPENTEPTAAEPTAAEPDDTEPTAAAPDGIEPTAEADDTELTAAEPDDTEPTATAPDDTASAPVSDETPQPSADAPPVSEPALALLEPGEQPTPAEQTKPAEKTLPRDVPASKARATDTRSRRWIPVAVFGAAAAIGVVGVTLNSLPLAVTTPPAASAGDAASTSAAADWLVGNAGTGERLVVDASMEADLVAAGWSASDVRTGSELSNWRDVAYVVTTSASASEAATAPQLSEAIANSVVVASFGDAAQAVDVRMVVPEGAVIAAVEQQGAASDRARYGSQLAVNPAITVSDGDRALLAEGRVDSRIAFALGSIAAGGTATVSGFPVVDGEQSSPIRQVALTDVGGAPLVAGDQPSDAATAILAGLTGAFAPADSFVEDGALVLRYAPAVDPLTD